MLQQVGRIVLLAGLALVALGAIVLLFARLGLGRLPGDLSFGGKGRRVYLPIGTCIVLSIALTLLGYLLRRFWN